jgi:hypothetical protein
MLSSININIWDTAWGGANNMIHKFTQSLYKILLVIANSPWLSEWRIISLRVQGSRKNNNTLL